MNKDTSDMHSSNLIYRPPENSEPLQCNTKFIEVEQKNYDPFRFCDPDKTFINIRISKNQPERLSPEDAKAYAIVRSVGINEATESSRND
jgi:hypothetical protein